MITDYENLSDEDLVILAKQGDLESINQLLYRYKTMVKSYARKFFLVGGETDDLIQEGMIALYNSIQDYSPDKNACFKTFATMCVKRQIYDAIRSASRNKHKPLNNFVSLYAPELECSLTNGNDPEAIYIAEESLQIIEEKIKELLNAEEKQIFELYLEGLSYLEIANYLDITVKKVDNKLQKIKRALKSSLK